MEAAPAAALAPAPATASVPATARDMVQDKAADSAAALTRLAISEYQRRWRSSRLIQNSQKKHAVPSTKGPWFWPRLSARMAGRATSGWYTAWEWDWMRRR